MHDDRVLDRSELMTKSFRRHRPTIWLCVFGVGCACAVLIGGCVAQQADVVRIKRELDGKIRQLNVSRTQLQQAVANANDALQEANAIIAQQRAEIQELLHARAELMDQLTVLKEGELSEVRGALERQAHHVRVLAGQFKRLTGDLRSSREAMRQHVQTVEPLMQTLQARLAGHENVLTEQRAKDEEFRQALQNFQSALTALRETQRQHHARIATVDGRLEEFMSRQGQESQRITKAMEELEKSMRTMVSAMEDVSRTLNDRVDQQERTLASLSGRMQSLGATQTGLDDQQRRIEQMSDAMAQLHRVVREALNRIGERVDAHDEELAQWRNRSAVSMAEPLSSPLPTRVRGQEKTPMASGSASPRSSHPDPADGLTQTVRDEYQRHHAELRRGDVASALRGFRQFLERYPDSSLAANAQYWLGECYYEQRQFQQAIVEFQRVFTVYPNSDKVPSALLKIGYSHLELKNPAAAKAVFRQLVRVFPESPEAAKAYARMAEIDGPTKGAS